MLRKQELELEETRSVHVAKIGTTPGLLIATMRRFQVGDGTSSGGRAEAPT